MEYCGLPTNSKPKKHRCVRATGYHCSSKICMHSCRVLTTLHYSACSSIAGDDSSASAPDVHAVTFFVRHAQFGQPKAGRSTTQHDITKFLGLPRAADLDPKPVVREYRCCCYAFASDRTICKHAAVLEAGCLVCLCTVGWASESLQVSLAIVASEHGSRASCRPVWRR